MRNEILLGHINNIDYEGETLEIERMFSVVKNLGVKLEKDGDMWCYVYGCLTDPNCIAGFGDTPEQSLRNFYREWKRIEKE